ncbi:signal transduction histidine kinase [Chloropicon primus]|uniref:Signal transduction histidine kinase n=1 Tax=Chloropicon primus TaxID=1764295 RepID=A0A5B8MTR1_9CHLO|nr:signal transduction histidine kinase [Chloropicon primus]UPR02984.1 signal transduction histidine kinase [Chloropicon primus]|eukprot:QDZ23771.1 signal transduction histidine kinase [Chloropicon primus]
MSTKSEKGSPTKDPDAPVEVASSDMDDLEQEAQEAHEILDEAKGKSLRELQKESIRIEENVLIAQKRVQFQRQQLQQKLTEAMEAKHLDERQKVQREKIVSNEKREEEDKKKRKQYKRVIISLFEELKMKTTELFPLIEANSKRNSQRKIVLEKRMQFQDTAKMLEEREKNERAELQQSHERTAKNLAVWQDLNMRHVSSEKTEGLLRVNRLMAQQLREIQRKEAEQLREMQQLKAKYKLSEFDTELEFVAEYELKKAEQLLIRSQKTSGLKNVRREAKKNILRLREQAKAANNLELNALKAKQMKAIEENRAKELKAFQQREAKRLEASFEQEITVMEGEMKDRLDDKGFNMSTFSKSTSHTGGHSTDAGSLGTKSQSGASGTQASARSMDSESSLSGGNDSSEQEKQMMKDDDIEFRKRVQAMREQAQDALKTAEERLHNIETQNVEIEEALFKSHEEEMDRVRTDYESKRNIVRKHNEDEVLHLIKQHAQEKSDIQKAHARELQLLESSIELETQLHQKSLHKSQVASHAKSEFLSFVCHELRNPLSAIVAVVDMLVNNNQMDMDEDTQEHIQSVKQESELMCAIVNDVLDFAKIEARMLVLEPVEFSIKSMVHDLVREQKLSAKKTRPNIELGFEIDDEIPQMIKSDPVRIRQVLLNLVSNAVKFTYHGSIMLSLKCGLATGPDTMMLEFSVKDTGVGIDKESLEHIFAAFSQAKPSITREFGGTGLGLSISKSLVERLGGKIFVESEQNQGTTFSFTVEAKIVTKDESSKGDEEKEDAKEEDDFPQGINLLIVEDSATLRRLWSKLLIEQGCVVSAAGNGQEALDKCAETKYDVILMDITMPVMSGDEAVKRLRESGWDQAVIALTANAMESDKLKYLEAGMDAVLTKPCRMDNLKKVIVEQLIKRRNPIVKM